MMRRRVFHNVDGVLIREDRSPTGQPEAYWRWNGERWARYTSIARVDYSGVVLDDATALETLREEARRLRGINLSVKQARALLCDGIEQTVPNHAHA
jgi:hypothetical protein